MLDHIAIIVTSEHSLAFYQKLGFEEKHRIPRENDTVIFLSDGDLTLEIFVDSTHPVRQANPEQNGLRHICITTKNILQARTELAEFNPGEIKQDWFDSKLFFVNDPDGQPIEIKERS